MLKSAIVVAVAYCKNIKVVKLVKTIKMLVKPVKMKFKSEL